MYNCCIEVRACVHEIYVGLHYFDGSIHWQQAVMSRWHRPTIWHMQRYMQYAIYQDCSNPQAQTESSLVCGEGPGSGCLSLSGQ